MEFLIWLTPVLIALVAYLGHLAISSMQDDLRLLKIKSEANTEQIGAIKGIVDSTNMKLSVLHDVKTTVIHSSQDLAALVERMDAMGQQMKKVVEAQRVLPEMRAELDFHKENHGKIILILNKLVSLRNK